jgi:hypothetical protein
MDDGSPAGIDTMIIVKFCILLIIGLVILSSIGNMGVLSTTSSTDLTFTDMPHDGDTVKLDNHTYEFDNNGVTVPGNIPVTIGTNLSSTVANFKAVVSANYGVT